MRDYTDGSGTWEMVGGLEANWDPEEPETWFTTRKFMSQDPFHHQGRE